MVAPTLLLAEDAGPEEAELILFRTAREAGGDDAALVLLPSAVPPRRNFFSGVVTAVLRGIERDCGVLSALLHSQDCWFGVLLPGSVLVTSSTSI